MTKEREALKLALEALKYPLNQSHENFNVDMAELLAHRAIIAIKEALAQPEQDYNRGYADAMNWKVQNHLEHLPPRGPQQEPVAWKFVPIKPTDEMLKAMDECSTEGYDERLYAGHAASVYMAAVDVAPTPPQLKEPEQEPVAWSYWQSCLNDDGTQTAPWVHRLSKFQPSESIINKDITPLYTTPPPCPTCEALARTVMMDQTGRDA